MNNKDCDPRHRISDPYGVTDADPYADVARCGNELEDSVNSIDPQLVGVSAEREDGFDGTQQKFLRKPDQPDREDVAPAGGALENLGLGLEFGGGEDDGFDAPQTRFFRERDQPDQEEAAPSGGALDALALDLDGGAQDGLGPLDGLDAFGGADLEVF